MDNTPAPAPAPAESSNPETLMAACTAMLARRRFSTCRDFALRLHLSLPSAADQILAIIDVLSAADRRDWYSALRLSPSDLSTSLDLARQRFKTLGLLLDPNSNSFPLSAEALTCLVEAWHVLSDPQRRLLYDRETAGHQPPQPPPQQEQVRGGTFWTACPYCWNMYEYEDAYEDCALRCEGCRKVFHGVAVKPPVRVETAVVDGQRREYYSCHASVPLRYYEVSENEEYEEEEDDDDDDNMGEPNFVYISDDDDVFGGAVKNVVQGNNENNGNNGRVGLQGNENNGKRKMRVKTVAKKAVGNRMMRRQQRGSDDAADGVSDIDADHDDDGDGGGGELEFTQGDDGDIFVGVRFT